MPVINEVHDPESGAKVKCFLKKTAPKKEDTPEETSSKDEESDEKSEESKDKLD